MTEPGLQAYLRQTHAVPGSVFYREPGLALRDFQKGMMPMTMIYLIRHAQAEGNVYRRCQGWYNSLITPKGYLQIEALERRFRDTHFDAVYSSDLFRTMTTAGAIYRSHGLPLHTDPQLREVGTGCWEDHTWGDLLHTERDSLLAFWRCDPNWQVPGSESFPAIQARFHTAVEQIANSHPDQTIAIVAHGSVIRSGLAYWFGLPAERINDVPHGDNTCVARLEYQDGRMKVCYYNDVSHLPPELVYTPHQTDNSDDALAAGLERTSLYFRPLELPQDGAFYLSSLRDSRLVSQGTSDGFDGGAALSTAKELCSCDPNSILVAMRGTAPIGLLQMDITQQSDADAGGISLVYLTPEARYQGLGVQLLGQAVSVWRSLGRQYLRLCCNGNMERRFFEKHGFTPSGRRGADTMELYIGYDAK